MRFIEQKLKLKVDNVDPPIAKNHELRHGLLFPNTIRALIVGPSGCGKTNLIFALLTNGIRFHNVYIYLKTLDQPKYKLLSDILKDIDGIKLFTFYENDEVIPPEKALPKSVFIFDDIICENQNIVRSYFSREWHNQINVFFTSLSLLLVYRNNFSMITIIPLSYSNKTRLI